MPEYDAEELARIWGATSKGSTWTQWLEIEYGEEDFDLFKLLRYGCTDDAEALDLWDLPESYIECGLIDMRTFMARAEGL